MNYQAVALSKGCAGIKQAIAVSHNPTMLVVERAPGKPIERLTSQEIRTIPPEHWQDLLKNVQSLHGRNNGNIGIVQSLRRRYGP